MLVEGITFSNISATTDPFILAGGKYVISTVQTAGTLGVNFTRLAADGATYLLITTFPIATSVQGVDGGINLPAGQYRLEWPGSGGPTAAYIEILGVE